MLTEILSFLLCISIASGDKGVNLEVRNRSAPPCLPRLVVVPVESVKRKDVEQRHIMVYKCTGNCAFGLKCVSKKTTKTEFKVHFFVKNLGLMPERITVEDEIECECSSRKHRENCKKQKETYEKCLKRPKVKRNCKKKLCTTGFKLDRKCNCIPSSSVIPK